MRHSPLAKGRIVVILSVIFALAVPAFTGLASAASPGSSVNVSNDIQTSSEPQVAVSGNHVYVVWVTAEGSNTTQVLFRGSSDFGNTWSRPINVSADVGPADSPMISASGKNVYVFWDDKTNGNSEVYFRESSNNGTSWGVVADLSVTKSPSRHFMTLVDGRSLYVAWVNRLAGNNEILFISSHDNGTNWSPPQDLSNNVNDSFNIGLASFGSNLFMVWLAQPPQFQVLQRTSTNEGVTWGNTTNISNDTGMSSSPQLFAQPIGKGGNLYIVWQDDTTGTFQTLFRASYNLGASWSDALNLSHDTGKSSNPVVGGQVVGGFAYVYVTWSDSTPGSNSVYLSISKNGGTSFVGPADLSPGRTVSTFIQLQVMAHSVMLLWSESVQGISSFMVRASQNFGGSFSSAQDLGPSSGAGLSAFFSPPAGSAGRTYAVWVNPNTGNGDIYLQGMAANADNLEPTQIPIRMLG